MPASGEHSDRFQELRLIAEKKLRHQAEPRPKSLGPKTPDPKAPLDQARTIHELQVYQLELELQNEELRRTQGDLEALRARYFDLYELAPMGYATLSPEGHLKDVNQRATSLLGLPKSLLLRQPLARFIAPEDRDAFDGFCLGLTQDGEPGACELRMVKPDGGLFWVHLEASRATDGGGRICLRLTLTDISELRRAQGLGTAMEEVLAKGRMAAYIAHEINNPLMGIRNAFLLLGKAVPAEHPHFHYAALIHQEINRIGNIVKLMYELHRPASRGPVLVAPSLLLEEVAALLEPKARAHGVGLVVEPTEPGLRAKLASDLLRQILFNLLQNALEASPPGSQVRCRASLGQGRLCIQVADEGPGIAPELRAKVFEPGFSTKQKLGGTVGLGIGLGSSLQLARGMGGKLSFENHGPCGPGTPGCTFTLDLPLDSAPPESGASHEP